MQLECPTFEVLVHVPSEAVVQNDRFRESNVRQCGNWGCAASDGLTSWTALSSSKDSQSLGCLDTRVVVMEYKSGAGIDRRAFAAEVWRSE